MRATDDRYRGEQAKFELAMRMIRHEARTGTIRYFTGLNDDRIRKLYTTYFKYSEAPVRRQRGRSPTRVGAARADAAARARVGRVREPAARERLDLDRAAAGPAAEAQRRPRPSLLRVLRDVRRAWCRAARCRSSGAGICSSACAAATSSASRAATRARSATCSTCCRCRARRARPACCSSSAAPSSRSPRPGSMAACASSSSALGVAPRYPLLVAANRDEQHARPAARRGVVARRRRTCSAGAISRPAARGSPIDRRGRFAAVTNIRDPAAADRRCARAARSSPTSSAVRDSAEGYAARAVARRRGVRRVQPAASTTAASSALREQSRGRRAARPGHARVQQRAARRRVAEDRERACGRRAVARRSVRRADRAAVRAARASATTRERREQRYQRTHFVVGATTARAARPSCSSTRRAERRSPSASFDAAGRLVGEVRESFELESRALAAASPATRRATRRSRRSLRRRPSAASDTRASRRRSRAPRARAAKLRRARAATPDRRVPCAMKIGMPAFAALRSLASEPANGRYVDSASTPASAPRLAQRRVQRDRAALREAREHDALGRHAALDLAIDELA